jgi:hypothetical protein
LNPGSKYCNAKWSRRYNVLIERYQQVVRMQLFGHEDEEYFQLQYGYRGNTTIPFGFTFQGGKASSLD